MSPLFILIPHCTCTNLFLKTSSFCSNVLSNTHDLFFSGQVKLLTIVMQLPYIAQTCRFPQINPSMPSLQLSNLSNVNILFCNFNCLSNYVFCLAFSRYCELECPQGLYGRNCSDSCLCRNNAICSKADGTCNCTVPGLTGVLCDKPCHAGYYGVDCVKRCNCHNGGACDRVTGMSKGRW